MLQLKTIHKNTYDLLKELSTRKELNSFALAGGTALALLLGHRISIDLDFLTENEFESFALFEQLDQCLNIEKSSTSVHSLTMFIQWHGSSVKTDFVRHNYPRLRPYIIADGIKLFSIEDIAAMKLNAVANRGAKKDFYDIHALLSLFPLPELLRFFTLKYKQLNSFTVTQSLTYFEDADLDPDPISLSPLSWAEIKKDLGEKVRESV